MGKGERSMKTLNKQISYLEEVLKHKKAKGQTQDLPQLKKIEEKVLVLKNQAPVFHHRDKDITNAMPHMPVVHCISADRAQTKGLAKIICQQCPQNKYVQHVPVGYVSVTRSGSYVIFNLVTKNKFYEKPTYESLDLCLIKLREALLDDPTINKIAIPELGCGLDLLSWNRVFPMVKVALKGLALDVYIYKK